MKRPGADLTFLSCRFLRPFAKRRASLWRMARRNRDSKAIDNTVDRSRLRSSLFRWMVKRHDDLVAKWSEDGKVDWRASCEEFVELGLTDLTGKPASEKTARQTWFRVRKHVAVIRAKQAALAPRPINPSRMPKDWRPANAPPQSPNASRPAAPPVLQNQLAPVRTGSVQADGYDPDEHMAHLFRTFRQRSGR
jgi:hypothetical protein